MEDALEVGYWLFRKWRFSPSFLTLIALTRPLSAPRPPKDLEELAPVLGASGWLADIWAIEDKSVACDVAERAVSYLGIPAVKLADFFDDVAELFPEVAQALDIFPGSEDDIEIGRTRAKKCSDASFRGGGGTVAGFTSP